MTALPRQASSKRRLLLASDRGDQSRELADILRSVGEVDTIATSDIPVSPDGEISGVVVEVNLRSPESVQTIRNKLHGKAYSEMPRLFVLSFAIPLSRIEEWQLAAIDKSLRPLDAPDQQQRIRAAFRDCESFYLAD